MGMNEFDYEHDNCDIYVTNVLPFVIISIK